MEIGFAASHDRNFSLKKEVEFSCKRTLLATRAFGDRLNAAKRFRAPRDDQTRVAEFSFAKKNCLCVFHSSESTTRTALLLQFAPLPAMMSDAHGNNRNGTRAGRRQRPTAASARRRNHVAAHISCAKASQLSTVLLGPARLAYRHVDAADCDELVRVPNHELKISTRRGGCGRICAHDAFIDLGRRSGCPLP